ncbi:hypothetical protein BDV95DRAFT_586236 [Massariosphaeria phaeospora]|uniref:Uncharacterized protein n=1 Tax=Massariosphaeria phaeospora TaxID=100035 RepID=A0A7C8MF75_9PLEO|nr:hypothetical protein BDV95DRAFT_586236 [Massariosphaeria phaeospora]
MRFLLIGVTSIIALSFSRFGVSWLNVAILSRCSLHLFCFCGLLFYCHLGCSDLRAFGATCTSVLALRGINDSGLHVTTMFSCCSYRPFRSGGPFVSRHLRCRCTFVFSISSTFFLAFSGLSILTGHSPD